MEEFIKMALGFAGITAPAEDLPVLAAQLAGMGEAAALVQNIHLNEFVPALIFEPEVGTDD